MDTSMSCLSMSASSQADIQELELCVASSCALSGLRWKTGFCAGLRGHHGVPNEALEDYGAGGADAAGAEGAGGRGEPADQVQAPHGAPGAHHEEQACRGHAVLLDLQPRGPRHHGLSGVEQFPAFAFEGCVGDLGLVV